MNKTEKGKLAEDLACKFLTDKGFLIYARNYHSKGGEIDIVCHDGHQLVFCEVKSKFGLNFGSPEEEMTHTKIERLENAITCYIQEYNINHDNYRIDLVAMDLDVDKMSCKIRHYKNYC